MTTGEGTFCPGNGAVLGLPPCVLEGLAVRVLPHHSPPKDRNASGLQWFFWGGSISAKNALSACGGRWFGYWPCLCLSLLCRTCYSWSMSAGQPHTTSAASVCMQKSQLPAHPFSLPQSSCMSVPAFYMCTAQVLPASWQIIFRAHQRWHLLLK